MRKRKKLILLVLILILCITVGIIVFLFFGEKHPNIITVDGVKYDLSEDFQDVVGKMVENDIEVSRFFGNYNLYNKKGKYVPGTGSITDRADILAEERNQSVCTQTEKLGDFLDERGQVFTKHGYLLNKVFIVHDIEDAEVISGLGISSIDDEKKKLDTKTFMKTDTPTRRGDYSYTAVFVNGKALDFTDYEEQLEEMKEYEFSLKENPRGILAEFIPHYASFNRILIAGDYWRHFIYEDLESSFSKSFDSLDEELLIHFALEDAYEQLEEEEADSFIVISFDIEEDDDQVNMVYSEFYFAKKWKPDKHRSKE